uniref:Protein disulfide-isomerase n=1 Tax=Tetradesmus obliquus TaxID=3088 RepID=A0A383WK23_TETOB|eukprot:jgi/Sobl393_1/587/SZX69760.1
MNKLLIAALFGLLLLSAPFVRGEEAEKEDEYEDDSASEDSKGGDDEEKDVVVITTKNWDDTVKKAPFALVEFYAPWCGHCQKLKPEYAKAATELKKYDDKIVIGKVDATVESDLGQKFGVQGYPTLKWFVDGELVSDYGGPRDASGISRWVQKKTGPAAATLADKDALEAAEKGAEVLVLGYFKDFKGAEHEAFIKVAQANEDATFVQTSDKAVAKAAGLDKAGSVTVITNFPNEERQTVALKGKITKDGLDEERQTVALKGKITKDGLGDLIKSEKLPPTIEFNDQNSQKIFSSGIEKQLLLIANEKDLKADAELFKSYRKVALEHKGKLVMVTVNMDGTAKDPVVNFFGVKAEDAPVVVGFEMAKNKKYKLKGDLSEKALGEFAASVLDGTAEAEYKSAPIPDEPTDGGVSIIVGKNFDSIVKDEEKDVLLEVYAPWCGHCKALEPVYKKLAKRFAKVDTVVIAKMDGTENEHPDVEVKGFPTIIFYPAGKDAKPITFDGGDRSLKALTKFIKKNAVSKFELPKKKKSDDGEKDAEEEDDKKDEL